MDNSDRNKIKRAPKRAIYDRSEIYKILDKEYLCHIGFIHNGAPVVIPTMFGREGDKLLVHGAAVSRLAVEISKGIDVCVSVAIVNGLVLARSAFHHSLNYESVVIFGRGKEVEENNKLSALKVISDHLIKDRWDEVREPNKKELKATKVVEIDILEISGKSRNGDPIDDKEDYQLDVWAGVLPIEKKYGKAIPDSKLKKNIKLSKSILEANLLIKESK